MLEAVKARLIAIRVPVSNEPSNPDGFLLEYAIQHITNYMNNQTNLTAIPEELFTTAVNMVVGEFLWSKKSMGQLDIETLNFDAPVKQVQDGDTNVVYAVESKDSTEAKFTAFINQLRMPDISFAKYRVFRW